MPDPNHDVVLVLGSRIAVLKRNLKEVQQALNSVSKWRDELRTLSDLPGEGQLKTSLKAIAENAGAVREAWGSSNAEAMDSGLKRIESAARTGLHQLDQANKVATPLANRSLEMVDDEVGKTLAGILHDEADKKLSELNKLEKLIDEAERIERDGDGSEAALAMRRKAWKRYSESLDVEIQEIFAEYVDLLAGLAVRDANFDRGICRIADELIRSCGPFGDYSWRSLTVPAGKEALGMTLARIIRLGFPEWTVWALPLTAREFAHVLIGRSDEMQTFVNASKGKTRDHRPICLADASATYLMGPAYACAAMLMRLDPWSAFTEGHGGAKRVEVILATLRKMSSPSVALDGIADQLEKGWKEALRQTGVTGSLTKNETTEIAAIVAFVKDFMGAQRGLGAAAWGRVTDWADLLVAGRENEIEVKVTDELRFVLNAAWNARLITDAKTPGIDHDTIARIGTAAEDLSRRIGHIDVEADRPPGGALPPVPAPPAGASAAPEIR